MNIIVKIAGSILFVFLCGCSVQPAGKLKKEQWVLGGFERPKGVNPIIEPDTSSVFMIQC